MNRFYEIYQSRSGKYKTTEMLKIEIGVGDELINADVGRLEGLIVIDNSHLITAIELNVFFSASRGRLSEVRHPEEIYLKLKEDLLRPYKALLSCYKYSWSLTQSESLSEMSEFDFLFSPQLHHPTSNVPRFRRMTEDEKRKQSIKEPCKIYQTTSLPNIQKVQCTRFEWKPGSGFGNDGHVASFSAYNLRENTVYNDFSGSIIENIHTGSGDIKS